MNNLFGLGALFTPELVAGSQAQRNAIEQYNQHLARAEYMQRMAAQGMPSGTSEHIPKVDLVTVALSPQDKSTHPFGIDPNDIVDGEIVE